MAMDRDDRWVRRSPARMLETFHWFAGEGFHLILEDLLALPADPGWIAEGLRLLPELVRPALHDLRRSVWLLPTPEFRRAALEARGALRDIAERTSAPDRALHNLLERDRMFTDRLRREVGNAGLPSIEVDLSISEETLVGLVGTQFGL